MPRGMCYNVHCHRNSGAFGYLFNQAMHDLAQQQREAFESTYGPKILAVAAEHSTCGDCLMAVSAQETGYGTAPAVNSPYNNLFGIDDVHPADATHPQPWLTIHQFTDVDDSIEAFFTRTYAGGRVSGAMDIDTFLSRMEDKVPRYNANVDAFKAAITNRYNEITSDQNQGR